MPVTAPLSNGEQNFGIFVSPARVLSSDCATLYKSRSVTRLVYRPLFFHEFPYCDCMGYRQRAIAKNMPPFFKGLSKQQPLEVDEFQ